MPFVKAVNPAVYRRFIEQKYFSNVGRVHKEREERQARLEAEMALMGLSEASRAHMRKMLQTKESNYMRMQRARMDESMFIRIKRLGMSIPTTSLRTNSSEGQTWALRVRVRCL